MTGTAKITVVILAVASLVGLVFEAHSPTKLIMKENKIMKSAITALLVISIINLSPMTLIARVF
jgi:hypothetical protein